MPIIVRTNRIRAGDKVYVTGSVIHDLDEAEEARLVQAGHAEYPVTIEAPAETTGPLTVEQFTELKAEEQKTHLKSLEIQVGTNGPQRIEQYTKWLEEQEGEDPDKDSDEESDEEPDKELDGTGPATGLPIE